jgi:carbamoyl-phosphate synthase small subunit
MRGVLSASGGSAEELVERARNSPSMAGLDLATRVTAPERYEWTQSVDACSPSERTGAPAEPRFHVVAYDFGIKHNILRRLVHVGCRVTVVPAMTTAEDVLSLAPDGVFLSNGPGDPEPLQFQAAQVRKLIGRKPVFGICLGHQIMSLALGARTFKLRFGHHGGNHPVAHLASGRVEITSQNHNYAVDESSLPDGSEVSHRNLNDGDVEGVRTPHLRAFSVQYHPEAGPGPHDARYLFREFVELMAQ